MKVGIAGFSSSGKSTMFHWLTAVAPDPAASQRGQVGMAKVPDARLDWLSDHFHPKKTTPATLEILDTPGLLLTETERRLLVEAIKSALLPVTHTIKIAAE